MSLTSASFFVFLAVTITAFRISTSVLYRRLVLGTANAVFIASYVNNFTEALPLLAFLALGYLCVSVISVRRSGAVLCAVPYTARHD
jgi:alginate O-acetyltransferase complex protein AlgI